MLPDASPIREPEHAGRGRLRSGQNADQRRLRCKDDDPPNPACSAQVSPLAGKCLCDVRIGAARLGVWILSGRRSPGSEAEPAELPLSCRQKHLRLDVSPRSSRNMQHLALSLAIDGFRRACILFRQHRERIRHRRALSDGNGRFGHIRRSCDLGRLDHGRSGDDHRRSGIEDNTLGPFAI